MTELGMLHALLLASMAVAPLASYVLARPSRWELALHAGAWSCAAAGLLLPAPALTFAWPLFCAASFARFLWQHAAQLRSPHELARCVPYVFSLVAAVWLVGGANDLRVLGYGPEFSYYAALHGNVLGWTLIGAIAALAHRPGQHRDLHLASVLVCFASFLLIAFGIDQLRMLKPIGVVGLSLALPASQLAFLRRVRGRDRAAFALGCVSLGGLACTMALAWGHELALPATPDVLGVRGMVSVHGVLNALVVAPCFLAAVAAQARDPQPDG